MQAPQTNSRKRANTVIEMRNTVKIRKILKSLYLRTIVGLKLPITLPYTYDLFSLKITTGACLEIARHSSLLRKKVILNNSREMVRTERVE